jgi:hypothetical protein
MGISCAPTSSPQHMGSGGGRISGVVRDPNGAFIARAMVTIEDAKECSLRERPTEPPLLGK